MDYKLTKEELKGKYESIRALGSGFELTQANFFIDRRTGLPIDEEEADKYEKDYEAWVSNADDANRPAGDDSYSDWFDLWHDLHKKDYRYRLSEIYLNWKPPPDLGKLSLVSMSNYAGTSSIVTSDRLSGGVNQTEILSGPELTSDSVDDNIDLEDDILMQDHFGNIGKYWFARHVLFSKFDAGIKLDEESWYSVTPECIAKHHALRCGNGVVVDCFTGVGGNAIGFAPISDRVIAIDIDSKKINYAKHNAAIYEVENKIEFVTADCFIYAKGLEADTVFLSPPWGGPEYAKTQSFDINMLQPHDGHVLFNFAKQIAPRVVMFLPRNVNIGQLAHLALSTSPPWTLEIEKNFINGRLKAITAYFLKPS